MPALFTSMSIFPRGHGGCGGGFDGGEVCEIDCRGMNGVRHAHLGRSLRERRCIHIPQRDARPRGKEAFGNGAANAPSAARDDGDAVLDIDLIDKGKRW